jgi:hypothetical protein
MGTLNASSRRGSMTPVDAMRRKLKALIAVIRDPAATEHERANAERLGANLKKKLKQEGAPVGDWSDHVFRFGRMVQRIGKTRSPARPGAHSSEVAFRLGKAVRHGLKKWEEM